MRNIIVVITCLLFLAFSCDRKETGSEEKMSTQKGSRIKKEISLITDSLNDSWNDMIESDDQKIKDIKRLLDEVSYTSRYNTRAYDSLIRLQQQLTGKRYTAESMSESKKIDDYDSATDSLLRRTFALVNATPEMENHSITSSLISDITEADNNVVRYRIRYDHWADDYNKFIDKHEKQLKKLGDPYAGYKKRARFMLGN